jgi:hypothetical protein
VAWLTVCCASLVAAAAERPDAVIVTEPDARLLCSLFPALARLGNPPLLLHASDTEPYLIDYVDQTAASHVLLIDRAGRAPAAWHERFRVLREPAATLPLELSRQAFPSGSAVVLIGGSSPEIGIAGSLLATARGIPAVWFRTDGPAVLQSLRTHEPPEIVLVGESDLPVPRRDFASSKVTELKNMSDVLTAYEAALQGTVEHLVVVRIRHRASHQIDSAWLMPQYAVLHRAAVAFLDDRSDDEAELDRLLHRYPSVQYVTLWGDTDALPDIEVEDPVSAAGLQTRLAEGKFPVQPLSGLARREPCRFRVGRITGDSRSAVSLLVARSLRRPPRPDGPSQALVLANVDEQLPLMETITRTTAETIEQAGWRMHALYGWRAAWHHRPGIRWGADLVLYEGHTANLQEAVPFDLERDPVAPGLYVFQGCRTLVQPQVAALIRNGAAGVVGTTTKTYSASGSALAKAFVDAMLLDGMDAGTSLMVARNFMLALAQLGERRQHRHTSKIVRGGMTFALWGDPTWSPPLPARSPETVRRVTAVRNGSAIELHIPDRDAWPPSVAAGEYAARIPLGAKLAGWYEWEDAERTRRQLPPLYFAVLPLPDYDAAEAPNLSSHIAANRWTAVWDSRNRWLYLLVHSARSDRDEGRRLPFRIESAARGKETGEGPN